MKKISFFRLKSTAFILTCFVFFSCTKKGVYDSHNEVHIENKSGKFTLFKSGRPYYIKGAAGFTYLKKLNEIGGNTIRIYDTTNLENILDDAEANHITVIVGLPITDNKLTNSFYADTAKVRAQLNAYKNIIEKFKKHPAVLMWCMGNELDFKFNLKYWNFYKAYNNLVDMVHTIDPDHPVTATVIDVSRDNIYNIKLWTNTDLISINSFGGLHNLGRELKDFSWFWKEPYLILEWGIKGPWTLNKERTHWGSFIEATSSKKSEQYLKIYKQDLPLNGPRLLGSFVFYWGEKQEYTHTWFSMFYQNGAVSEVVGMMQYVWTGKWPQHPAPQVNYMLVDKKGALDNLIYKPGRIANAEILMARRDSSISNIKWEVYHEDWYVKDNLRNLKRLIPIDSLVIGSEDYKATFKTPSQEGPYRVFATVFDKFGNYATCNTPFYVIK